MIKFTVHSTPVGQPRPRATMAPGGKFARVHELTHTGKGASRREHPILQFRHSVKADGMVAMTGRQPLQGPIEATIVFVFPRVKKYQWKSRPMPRRRHTGKPDFDNAAKAVCDSLNGVCWSDDSQVSDVVIRKRIAAGDEQPHVEISIREVSEEIQE